MALFLIFLCVWPSIYMQNQLQAYRNAYLSYYIMYIYILFHFILYFVIVLVVLFTVFLPFYVLAGDDRFEECGHGARRILIQNINIS